LIVTVYIPSDCPATVADVALFLPTDADVRIERVRRGLTQLRAESHGFSSRVKVLQAKVIGRRCVRLVHRARDWRPE
jgi:hypothetical protein